MTTMNPEDAIKAASSVAREIADGTLSPTDLEGQGVAELCELFGTVVGPDGPRVVAPVRHRPPGARAGRRARR